MEIDLVIKTEDGKLKLSDAEIKELWERLDKIFGPKPITYIYPTIPYQYPDSTTTAGIIPLFRTYTLTGRWR